MVRNALSKNREKISQLAASKSHPFIVDFDYRVLPPTISVVSKKENKPCSCHGEDRTWAKAMNKAKTGALVARITVPAGSATQSFLLVMPELRIAAGIIGDGSEMDLEGEPDLDEETFNPDVLPKCGPDCDHAI